MGRAPCCEKVGLKKGPWSPEEDETLVAYIEKHGHANWRALPKDAGLLRCGKSCRLRWINYLRPDIKRGNFTNEEEEKIISLHQSIGNRWSAIAAQLPGRTDNEIKNIWHTYLKKKPEGNNSVSKQGRKKSVKQKDETKTGSNQNTSQPQCTTTSFSSSSIESCSDKEESFLSEELQLPEIDESFMTKTLSMDVNSAKSIDKKVESENISVCTFDNGDQYSNNDDMEFWLNVFVEAGGALDMSQI